MKVAVGVKEGVMLNVGVGVRVRVLEAMGIGVDVLVGGLGVFVAVGKGGSYCEEE